MSLRDKVQKLAFKPSFVTVEGIRFQVTGKSLLDGSEIQAKADRTNKERKKSGYAKLPIDCFWLEACVSDADDASTLTAEEWSTQPRKLTAPLVVVVMQDNGLDDDDIERDPKDYSTTAT